MTSSRRKHFSLALAIAGLGLLASGCANQTTSYRTQRVGGNAPLVITEDAKLRNVIMVPETDPGRAGQWRVCAEASPDVFSALSASGAANLGLNTRGQGSEAQARAAMAIAEAAGTIERTQTINMLRESMYRTCERYMSGAIDRATFVVQAGRDWRAMIAILAIEQLTRAARPSSTVISAGSTSANVEDSGEATRQLAAATGRASDALRRQQEAQAGPPATCPPPTTPAPTPDAIAACDNKQRLVARATAELQQARDDIATWRAVAASGATDSAGGNTTALPNANQPGPPNQQPPGVPSDTALAQVASTVGSIVSAAFNTDETQLFCLQVLSADTNLRRVHDRGPDGGASVEELCIQYLSASVRNDIRQLQGWQVSAAAAGNLDRQIRLIEDYLRVTPGTPAARWNVLAARVQLRFPFSQLALPANATMDQILRTIRANAGAVEELVRATQGDP